MRATCAYAYYYITLYANAVRFSKNPRAWTIRVENFGVNPSEASRLAARTHARFAKYTDGRAGGRAWEYLYNMRSIGASAAAAVDRTMYCHGGVAYGSRTLDRARARARAIL